DGQSVGVESGEENGVVQFAHVIDGDSVVKLSDGSRTLFSWSFRTIEDRPPVIRFEGEPRRAANGALELSYFVEDDYGVTKAEARFRLADEDPNVRPLYGAPEVPLPLPRRSSKDNVAKT